MPSHQQQQQQQQQPMSPSILVDGTGGVSVTLSSATVAPTSLQPHRPPVDKAGGVATLLSPSLSSGDATMESIKNDTIRHATTTTTIPQSTSTTSTVVLPPLASSWVSNFTGWKPVHIVARPGNIGVQIDRFRSLNMFHRPRTNQFTAHFRGLTFEDSSMENYERLKERQARKSRVLKERLEKLQQLEATRLEEDTRRKQKRAQREMDRQLRIQQRKQSAQEHQQQEMQDKCALLIQRHVRGLLAREQVGLIRRHHQQEEAAYLIKRNIKRFLQRQQSIRAKVRMQEENRRVLAAVVVQRQVRKHQSYKRVAQPEQVDALPHQHDQPDKSDHKDNEPSRSSAGTDEVEQNKQQQEQQQQQVEEDAPWSREDVASPAMSIELLFTDDEQSSAASSTLSAKLDELSPATDPTSSSSPAPSTIPITSTRKPKRPPPQSMRRVGGGFRHLSSPRRTSFSAPATAKAPVMPPLRRYSSLRLSG